MAGIDLWPVLLALGHVSCQQRGYVVPAKRRGSKLTLLAPLPKGTGAREKMLPGEGGENNLSAEKMTDRCIIPHSQEGYSKTEGEIIP